MKATLTAAGSTASGSGTYRSYSTCSRYLYKCQWQYRCCYAKQAVPCFEPAAGWVCGDAWASSLSGLLGRADLAGRAAGGARHRLVGPSHRRRSNACHPCMLHVPLVIMACAVHDDAPHHHQ